MSIVSIPASDPSDPPFRSDVKETQFKMRNLNILLSSHNAEQKLISKRFFLFLCSKTRSAVEFSSKLTPTDRLLVVASFMVSLSQDKIPAGDALAHVPHRHGFLPSVHHGVLHKQHTQRTSF